MIKKIRNIKSPLRDYLLFALILLITVILSLIFPEKQEKILTTSYDFFLEMLWILPAILILMGIFAVFVDKEVVEKYLGSSSGYKGIALSFFFGALPTGPLYIAFPLAAALRKKGAGIKNIVIFLSAWGCIKIPQELVELQFLGFEFMIVRLSLTVIMVTIMGILIEKIY